MKETIKIRLSEKLKAAGMNISEQDFKWLSTLKFDESGKPINLIENFMLILQNDPFLRGNITLPKEIKRSYQNLTFIEFGERVPSIPTIGRGRLHQHLEDVYAFRSFKHLKIALMLTIES